LSRVGRGASGDERRSFPVASAGAMPVIARLASYSLIAGLALQAVVVAAAAGDAHALFSEDGALEIAQMLLAAGAAALLIGAAARGPEARALLVVLGLGAVFAAIRELDGFLDRAITKGAYKAFEVPVVVAAAAVAWRRRARLAGDVASLLAGPAAYLLFFGAFVVLVHAQVLGQKELWHAVVVDVDSRLTKKAFEECSELMGYLMIAFGALEAWLWARRSRPL